MLADDNKMMNIHVFGDEDDLFRMLARAYSFRLLFKDPNERHTHTHTQLISMRNCLSLNCRPIQIYLIIMLYLYLSATLNISVYHGYDNGECVRHSEIHKQNARSQRTLYLISGYCVSKQRPQQQQQKCTKLDIAFYLEQRTTKPITIIGSLFLLKYFICSDFLVSVEIVVVFIFYIFFIHSFCWFSTLNFEITRKTKK